MSFDFTPFSDEELNAINLVPEGIYNFEVIKAERKMSKTGNPMCELQLRMWDNDGKTHIIFDYLVFSSVAMNIRKVKHFCDSVGLQEEYKKGSLPEDLVNYSGKAEVGIRDEQPKIGGGVYPRKNIVNDYVVGDKDSAKQASPSQGHADLPFDDSLPF